MNETATPTTYTPTGISSIFAGIHEMEKDALLKPAPKESIIPQYQIEDWQNELRCLMTRVNWLKKQLDLA